MTSLRILLLEDSPLDAELILSRLTRHGLDIEVRRVENQPDFVALLEQGWPNLILADYRLPLFDGMAALRLVRQRENGHLPFIFVSGVLGEETAIEAMKEGATDYVLKDRLQRLPAAVERAMVEARIRTDKKAAEENLQRLRMAIDDVHDYAIFTITPDGAISSWNQGGLRLLGYEEAEILGKPMALFYLPEDRDADVPGLVRTEARTKGRVAGERFFLRKDGSRFRGEGVISAVRNAQGQLLAYSIVLRDVTEIRKAQAEREALLERERAARSEAEKVNRVKDEFLAVLSHELRTPLNAILGWVQMMRRGLVGPEKLGQVMETIERNARSQAQLIEDLLDMSRIISGKITLDRRPLDLAEVARAAVHSVTVAAENKGLEIEVALEDGLWIMGDGGRLQQIILNLLSNAVKFTPQGGRITLTLHKEQGQARLTVRDTGIGIKPEFLTDVFQRFRQADASTTRRFGGLGLGLAIVQSLVEAHDGSITAESEGEGKGASFSVSLPLVTLAGESLFPALAEGDAEDVDFTGTVILVVEDEADTRQLIQQVFEQFGARVMPAANGEEAHSHLLTSRPSLIVSDIGLPGEDGYALIRRLRVLPEAEEVPALALTAYARPEDRDQALQAGFDDFLAKPVMPNRLITAAAHLLARGRGSSFIGNTTG